MNITLQLSREILNGAGKHLKKKYGEDFGNISMDFHPEPARDFSEFIDTFGDKDTLQMRLLIQTQMQIIKTSS